MHPKNAWYVACTADEVADKPLGRQICNEKMVFYRDQNQQVVALKISARTAVLRCRWVMSRTANWYAVITGW